MPIYEFSCAKCGKLAEVMQRVGERPPPCPSCGSKRMTRAVSRTAFHLKGGGWYADLYGTPRPDSGKAGAGTTGGADAKTGAAEKPAATTATPAKAEGGEKPAASKPGEPAAKKEATPKVASSPPERRPGTSRKRR
jgi:putative FmdB family regulatory protein